MMIQQTISIFGLSIIWCQVISAQLLAPPHESKCNPTLSGWNRAGCSINTDCACHDISKRGGGEGGSTSVGEGMCASTMISCSVLTPCENDRVTCKQPETICVQDHRCSNRPVCYPIALANLAVCPPVPASNLSIVGEPESEIIICREATWQNGKLVAGQYIGFELTEFNMLEDFIIDEDRNIYVADTKNHRIVKWSPNATKGELLAGGRGPGSAREQLNEPTSVLLTTTGDLIICDGANERIQRWSHNVNYGETLIGNIACNQLFTDKNGEILFSTQKNEIFKWTPTENGAELVMKAAGKNPPGSSSKMFLSRNGNVYVADKNNNRILKYTSGQDDAEVVAGGQAWSSSDLNHLTEPTAVVVDDKGALYITEYQNGRIVRWGAGDLAGVVLGKTEYLNALHFDRNGNLYVANYRSIIRLDIDTSACTHERNGTSILDNGSIIG